MRRNPIDPQRHTQANEQRTHQRIDEYQLLSALLATWEERPVAQQTSEREYISQLRRRVRQVKCYLLNRSDATIKI